MATTKKKTKKTRRRKSTPTNEEVWTGLKEEADLDNVKDYNMSDSFPVKSAINHPKFGLGVVTEVMNHKIEVMFKDGPKSLVQNRS